MTIQHKRGDTFSYYGDAGIQQVNEAGEYEAITSFLGWQIAAEIKSRHSQELIATMDASFVSPVDSGAIRIYHAADDSWPIGPAVMDVEFITPGGDVISTDTIPVNIVRDVTNAPST